MPERPTTNRGLVAAFAAAILASFALSCFAQNAAPTMVTIPGRPSENDDVTVRVTGIFPSTDFAVVGTQLSPRWTIPASAGHGANEFEFTATIRYHYGPVGGQALTPYAVDFPVGRFPRFARIKFWVQYVSDTTPASSWFTPQPYAEYLYVRDPEPPRLAVEPANATTRESLRVAMRFYHIGYHIARTTHEMDGNVVRIHQDVVYVGPALSPNPLSEAVVTHEIGALPAGNYTIEWRQSTAGGAEQLVATQQFMVLFAGLCSSCVTPDPLLPLERTSVSFDSIPLGEKAGTQTISLTPTVLAPTNIGPPPVSSMVIERIWTNNADYLFSHDCPAPPAALLQGSSCAVTVYFNPTLHGDSPGRLFVRYKSTSFGNTSTASAALSGRAMLTRSVNFIPGPTTPDTAVEYFAPALQHYFFTSSPEEQAFVDAGKAGAWQRTGVTFPIGGPTDVCRFYGDPVAGPNSHFYTGSSAECSSLILIDSATPRGKAAWRYEGFAFKAEIPLGVTGITPMPPPPNRAWCRDESSRQPVYRLYNDGFDKGIDSNHRHVPSRGTLPSGKTGEDIVREMMGQGWIYEGNALCN